MRVVMFIVLTIGLIFTKVTAQINTHELSARLAKISNASSIKGFGVAIYDDSSVLFSKGFGFSDWDETIPYTVNTVQKVASISKILLGVSLMKAVELNMLKLDDNVNDYLPFALENPHISDDIITIRHLATHTSGLKKTKKDLRALYFPTKIDKAHRTLAFGLKRLLFGKMIKVLDANEKYTLEDFLFNIYDPEGQWYRKRNFDKTRAGTKHIYSNTGASFLALILENASGLKYQDFLRKFIFQPLEMNNTYFDFEIQRRSEAVVSDLFHAGLEIPNDYNLLLFPAGGLETNVVDFAKLMSAMTKGYQGGNQILSYSSYQVMMTKQLNENFSQGILWEVYDEYLGHSGDIAGATTFSYFHKQKGIGYLLFCNTAMSPKIDSELQKIKECLKNSIEIGKK